MIGKNLDDFNQAKENPGRSKKNKKRPKSQRKPQLRNPKLVQNPYVQQIPNPGKPHPTDAGQ